MIEIKRGENTETADLQGRSIAEVREMYQEGFGISEKDTAKLNGQKVGKNQEEETYLLDNDQLSFSKKSWKSLVMLGSFILALVVTGGVFAFTTTVQSATISVTGASNDFASITTNSTPTAITLMGNHLGSIDAATMFDITGDASYTGDLEVLVTLTNADELVQDYSFWALRVEYVDSSNTTADLEGITKIISLSNPTTSFAVDSANISGGTFYIRTPGGSYRTLPFGLGSAGNDPVIFAEVVQAGAQ